MELKSKMLEFKRNGRKTVLIQGIGFVGVAMIAAISTAKDDRGNLLYNVIGVDLPDDENSKKINSVNLGIPPIKSADKSINNAYNEAHRNRNLIATSDNFAFKIADIIVVDINLDIIKNKIGNAANYKFSYENYLHAIRTIGENIEEETLVLIESTVPPGTTEKIIYPYLKNILLQRGLDVDKVYLAHSYERVMPGENYLNSITNYYRVFSGINEQSKIKAEEFLQSFINTKDYPLRKLHSTTASEMAKVLENSYRAMNIAFIQEWTEYAENAGVNLFEVISAIKDRSTHRNIMSPGLGVGGYCLTKDALLADYGYSNIFNSNKRLNLSITAININDQMPIYSYELLKKRKINVKNKNIGILGVSYLNDVGDTRNTPTRLLYEILSKETYSITLFDPYIEYWEEKNIFVNTNIKNKIFNNIEIIIFAVRHKQYLSLSADEILKIFPKVMVVFDANNVINDKIGRDLLSKNIQYIGLGKGDLN